MFNTWDFASIKVLTSARPYWQLETLSVPYTTSAGSYCSSKKWSRRESPPTSAAAIPVHSPMSYLKLQLELTCLSDTDLWTGAVVVWCTHKEAGVAAVFLSRKLEPASHSNLRHRWIQVRLRTWHQHGPSLTWERKVCVDRACFRDPRNVKAGFPWFCWRVGAFSLSEEVNPSFFSHSSQGFWAFMLTRSPKMKIS